VRLTSAFDQDLKAREFAGATVTNASNVSDQVYGSARLDNMLIPFIVNLIGLALNSAFAVCFAIYSDDKKRFELIREIGVFSAFTAVVVNGQFPSLQGDKAGTCSNDDSHIGYV